MTQHQQQPSRLSLEDAARKAVADQDGPRICRIADQLRFKHGLDYEGVMAFFERVGGDRDDIEGYFYEADCREGDGQ